MRQRNSLANRAILTTASCLTALFTAYWLLHVGILLIYFAWATFYLSLGATLAFLEWSAKTLLRVLDLVAWRPKFWTSTALSVCMRESR